MGDKNPKKAPKKKNAAEKPVQAATSSVSEASSSKKGKK